MKNPTKGNKVPGQTLPPIVFDKSFLRVSINELKKKKFFVFFTQKFPGTAISPIKIINQFVGSPIMAQGSKIPKILFISIKLR